MQENVIDEALDSLRPGLEADGFSLRLGDARQQGTVRVILEAGPESCLDCLVPEDMMVSVLENAIREKGVSVDRVELVKLGFDKIAEH